jgi:hypothetical protein
LKQEYDKVTAKQMKADGDFVRLQQEAKELTDKAKLAANKKAQKNAAAQRDVNKKRAEELKADYMNRVEEKETREEEEKFQAFIEEQYKKQDELVQSRTKAEAQREALEKEYKKLKYTKQKEANRKKFDFYSKQVEAVDKEME